MNSANSANSANSTNNKKKLNKKRQLKDEQKAEQEKKYKDVLPIFRVKPAYGSNTATMKLIGTVINGTKYGDEMMEFGTPKEMIDKYGNNVLHICDVNGYTVVGKMYHCNLPGSFLIKNKVLPVFYMSIIYERKFVTGFLFSIYVYFTINDETMSRLDDPKKYLTQTLEGDYKIELDVDELFSANLVEYAKPVLEEKYMLELVDNDNNLDKISDVLGEEEMNEIIRNVINKVNNRLKEYEDIQKPICLTKYPHKNVIINKHMKEMCKNKIFLELVKYGTQMRDDERRGDKDGNYTYKLPKRIFDYNELKDNPEKIDELLNDESLNRSSDESDNSDSSDVSN